MPSSVPVQVFARIETKMQKPASFMDQCADELGGCASHAISSLEMAVLLIHRTLSLESSYESLCNSLSVQQFPYAHPPPAVTASFYLLGHRPAIFTRLMPNLGPIDCR